MEELEIQTRALLRAKKALESVLCIDVDEAVTADLHDAYAAVLRALERVQTGMSS